MKYTIPALLFISIAINIWLYMMYKDKPPVFIKDNTPVILNIKYFGADSTGKIDSRNQIQNAFDCAQSIGNAIVYFPKGTYMCDSINVH